MMSKHYPNSPDLDDEPNRSDILFITDAEDCNPNGNPLDDNRPRKDPETGQGIITDVRHKHTFREQLLADGYDIYVKKLEGNSERRTELALDVLHEVDNVEDIEEFERIRETFLERAVDVRYFGAMLNFEEVKDREGESEESEERRKAIRAALRAAFPSNYEGPVQFKPAKSLNAVEENENYDSLTSVIASSDEGDQGGFDLADYRIKYGIYPFWGLVNNTGASDTNLTERDVRRIDTVTWRSYMNQLTSRSKLGQAPRLYMRVEYESGHFHVGGLHSMVELSEMSANSLQTVNDVVVDVSALMDTLDQASDRIASIHFIGDARLQVATDGAEQIPVTSLADRIEGLGIHVHEVDVIEERDLADGSTPANEV